MRILFVAFPNSIHSVRWINQITDQGWEVHLVPSVPLNPLDPALKGKVIFHGINQSRFSLRSQAISLLAKWPHPRGSGHVQRLIARLQKPPKRNQLENVIERVKPDIVHSMEMQQAGYLTLAAKERMGSCFPTWIMSNWGSDIYVYHRIAAHQERVKRVLASCDYYACECHRDVALAQRLGLKGKVLPVLPCAGGFTLERWHPYRQPGPTSKRRIILLKGYQHWVGRALVGLRAIELCADVIRARGFSVLIHLAAPEVEFAARRMVDATGISIEFGPQGEYVNAMRRFGLARIHLGLSISDGISQSLLESMVMGAFPIQSDTACANEWIEDGKSGFLVPPEDPSIIAEALRRAIEDDALVDEAVRINDETARQRLAYDQIKQRVVNSYRSVYAETSLNNSAPGAP